jgi:hypothetical protein
VTLPALKVGTSLARNFLATQVLDVRNTETASTVVVSGDIRSSHPGIHIGPVNIALAHADDFFLAAFFADTFRFSVTTNDRFHLEQHRELQTALMA